MIYIDRMTNYFKYINKKDLEKFSDLFDEQKASEWASKFDAETKKD